ncbi:hypothetical protein KP509_12G077000 [Ceratopteris richardii]|uniref:DUF1308 domain-containing protein n=1 Tax=Ceratopteris richardii TaxID=49495 RepID=A0A8T2TMZ5_CERRI|nr:hypothetical protein KP509_12G077000 [Ceratopteris richardii]
MTTNGAQPVSWPGTNLGYLEAIVDVLCHPHVDAVSAVLHKFKVSASVKGIPEAVVDPRATDVHVDVVCTLHTKPVWIIVSDRNPKFLYWSDACAPIKGWKYRVEQLTAVAQSLCVLRPSAVLFCFARGVSGCVLSGFEREIGVSHIPLFEEQTLNGDATPERSSLEPEGGLSETDDEDWVCINFSKDLEDLSSAQRPHYTFWKTFQVNITPQSEAFQSLQTRLLNSFKLDGQLVLGDGCVDKLKCSGTEGEDQHDGHLEMGQKYNNILLQEDTHLYDEACNDAFVSCLAVLSKHLHTPDQNEASFPVTSCASILNTVNLDTTVLIALVSEVSNGAASTVVNMCNEDLVFKFKSTAQFMRDQALEELEHPLVQEMADLFKYRRPFMTETVYREFKSLVSICGGFREKIRAEKLLELIPVVPDMPSVRVRNLQQTGKISKKNKVTFGTGDVLLAPTLTANLSFVRAVRQTGMALSILEHHPRALVGEKCS